MPQCLAPVATARRSTKDQVPVTWRRVIRSCQRCGRGCQRCEGLMERQAEAWHFHGFTMFHTFFFQVSLIHCLQGQVEDDGGDAFGGTSLQAARGAKIYTNCANGWIWFSPPSLSCVISLSPSNLLEKSFSMYFMPISSHHVRSFVSLPRVCRRAPSNALGIRNASHLATAIAAVEICISLDDSIHVHVLA